MKLHVNAPQRYAKMRAHTATHLLHFALNILLDGTKQAGSLVDEDYLRFDFATKKPLSQEQRHDIEQKINQWIYQSLPVDIKEMSYDEAVKSWAKAFFEDKYGDTVRVVSIINHHHTEKGTTKKSSSTMIPLQSIELCWWNHVINTKDIWAFTIISQEAVASGIRRIVAVTGTKVYQHADDLNAQRSVLSSRLDCQPKQLDEKLGKVLKELEQIKDKYESLQTQLISSHLDDMINTSAKHRHLEGETTKESPSSLFDYILNITNTPLASSNFKNIINQAKSKRSDKTRVIYNDAGNFAIFAGTKDFSAKNFAQQHGLKGGGSDQLVQGRDEKVKEVIKSRIITKNWSRI